ncbi:RHS repeat-associated core domain-containing protein [Gilliamella sp. Lep-s21]|uniref:RHS repeat-associated core domain-containing protein n=1 Tax=unclassified Gilliamella TaxID=2685620 RepID=UPI00301D35EC
MEFDIYGRIREDTFNNQPFIPFRQLGQYEDVETGLYYNRFRYYNPETGLYISQDPIKLAGNNPNFYAYVHDSNAWVDPFGLWTYYQLKDSNGNVVYHGITDRTIEARLREHISDGKLFNQVSYVDNLTTRVDARNLEGSALFHDRNKNLLNSPRPVSEGYYHSYNPDNLAEGRTFLSQADIDQKMKTGKTVDVGSKGKIKCH